MHTSSIVFQKLKKNFVRKGRLVHNGILLWSYGYYLTLFFTEPSHRTSRQLGSHMVFPVEGFRFIFLAK